jgi:tRNA pseudouridine38-40 synthase
MNLKIEVAYDGSGYVGWQRQPNGLSIQEKIEQVLKHLSGKQINLHGASRTDTGVHALGMVANFEWPVLRPTHLEIIQSLNSLLPEDIRILSVKKVSKKFHARFDAKWKLYRYRILNSNVQDPFRRQFTWWIQKRLNVSRMKKAASFIKGKHDFSSLAVNPGYERESMIRRIRSCEVKRKGDEIHIEVLGNGFLYKMVRTMVGTLVEVGKGKRSPQSIKELLSLKDRTQAGKTAPAQGLFLVKVIY